jgi:hypothetical protein
VDFIDWCHRVLRILDDERLNAQLSEHRLREILFGDEINDTTRPALRYALGQLAEEGLAEQGKFNWKITPFGRKVLSDPIEFWASICAEQIDSEETDMLRLINELSPQQETTPEFVRLEDVTRDPILQRFGIEPPPPKTNEHMKELGKYLYDLPGLLADRRFLTKRSLPGYHTSINPTYRGLVWETRRDFTIESKFIDSLLAEWETTNVDFKREFGLDTQKQKGDFAKDMLGLVTTKSSGRRYMIIGFDDKTRQYYGPPDPAVTQNRMEQVLSNLTEPVAVIRYDVIAHKGGKVGRVEVIRQPDKLPYHASQDVFDEKGKRVLEKGKVYVRHGSQTESPTDAELEGLKEEGLLARGN